MIRKVHRPLAAATGCLVVLAACGRRADPRGIEHILTGTTILTMDSSMGGPAPTAIALGGGRVIALGNADSVVRWNHRGVTLEDLRGAVVAPAFTDHHVHLYNVGLALLNAQSHQRLFLDLTRVTSLQAVQRMVSERAGATPAGSWVLGTGWSQATWGTQALPSGDLLTRAAPDHPVFLSRTDGHAGWVNAQALALASRPGPGGVLLERENEPVVAGIPQPSDTDVMEAYRLAADTLAAHGVVEVYDAGALAFPGVVSLEADFARALRLLCRADSIRPLPIMVNLMIPAPSRLADSLLDARPADWTLTPRIRITHLKLFADGALGSRGAALTRRYADDPATSGVARMTAAEITAWTGRALDAGLGVATHAIGDLAVARTLDGYERVLRERPGLDPNRLRIEHFSYAREEDFGRAVRLGIVLSVQSNFNSSPGDHPSFGEMRIGAAGEPRVYAWNRLYEMGAKLAEGSDYFSTPGDALAGFLATLTRKYAVGEHRPDPAARVLAWRLNALRYPREGPVVDPAIRPGSPANLVVLSGNPLEGARSQLPDIRVLRTMRNGSYVGPAITPR